jgi:hypothetical protein
MKNPTPAGPSALTVSSTARAWNLVEDLIFTEGGLTLFFVLPAVIALFLIEAMPQF